jgi:HSP20 family protein
MFKDKRSFFERITGSVPYEETPEEEETVIISSSNSRTTPKTDKSEASWLSEEEEEEGELTVDVYQTPTEVVIQTMVAGVKPEDLNISITREIVTIKGRRERPSDTSDATYVNKELYWGAFTRTMMLPAEVEVDQAEAIERHGLMTIRLPKTDKERIQKIKVKSI